MATPAGFEPATIGLEGRRSDPLSYGAIQEHVGIWRHRPESNRVPFGASDLQSATLPSRPGACFWRRERDSNPRIAFTIATFPRWCLKPLGHLSVIVFFWRRERDSNPWIPRGISGFRNRRNRPLCHLSESWWTLPDSNRPPPACKAGALPDELKAQILGRAQRASLRPKAFGRVRGLPDDCLHRRQSSGKPDRRSPQMS